MQNIEKQVQNAIANERSENRNRERAKSVFVVFLVIPAVVIGVIAAWLIAQRMGAI